MVLLLNYVQVTNTHQMSVGLQFNILFSLPTLIWAIFSLVHSLVSFEFGRISWLWKKKKQQHNNRVNVSCGQAEERVLLTGLHAVADIYCECCKTPLGWKYVSSYEIAFSFPSNGFWLFLLWVLRLTGAFSRFSRKFFLHHFFLFHKFFW